MKYETLDGVEIIDTTEKAIRIAYEDRGETIFTWIPRSLCEHGDDLHEGDKDVCVAAWFVSKEGLPT